ncbi:uncharacterized protein [Rutidosis leptorrhynchoides]|uniref:uncharacterized protein n=1 Tax=Rutidosis leptorrhynchoides TaxID=125765 RepID=UPI003A993947
MADRNTTGPSNPGTYRAPDGVVDSDDDQSSYILELESKLKEAEDKINELELTQFQYPMQNQFPQQYNVPPQNVYPYQNPYMMNQYQMPLFPQQFIPPPKKCSYKNFRDCKPPEFSGSTDPTETLNWLREMEQVFEACQCEPELRVTYASRMLKGRAMVWWDSLISSIPNEQISMITWEQFYGKVCEQYCNPFDLNRIKTEFLEMKMTPQMTIDEVVEKYMDKLRFVQQWVPDESSRIQHFVNVILPEYRTFVRTATSLSQAIVLAKMVESDVKAARSRMFGNVVNQGGQASSQSGSKSKKSGHRAANCPSKSVSSGVGSGVRSASAGGSTASSGQKKKNPPSAEARAFQMSVETATATDDVITVLGKNWMSLHKAHIKCDKKIVTFRLIDGTRVVARGERGGFSFPLISVMKAKKSLAKGCEPFLAYVIDAKKEKKTISDIPVVSEFPEVFPDELPGLPPVRDVEYKIELMPGTTPIAKAPYRLAPSEIREMIG